MEYKIIVEFLKEQIYIFGVCPCCNEIFNLADTAISVKTKKAILSESKKIIEMQAQNQKLTDNLEALSVKLEENKYGLYALKDEMKNNDTAEVIKRKKEGRKHAIKKTQENFPIFYKKNIDPRDTRLIFSPVEFIIFDGMAENNVIEDMILLSKKPATKEQETIAQSIQDTIKKGNVDFKIIRFTDNGKILYE